MTDTPTTTFVDPAALFASRDNAVRQQHERTQAAKPANPNTFAAKVSVGPQVLQPNGTLTQHAVSSVNTGHAWTPNADSIVDTGRSQSGTPRNAASLRENDLVSIHGTEMLVSTAVRLGYLDKGPNGAFQDTGLAKQQKAEPPHTPDKAEEAPAVGFDNAHVEAELGDLCGNSSPGAQVAVMGSILDTGEVSANVLVRAASELRCEPHELQGKIATIQQQFHAQAAKAVASQGVNDAEAMFAWAEANRPQQFRKAMEQHVMERNPRAYDELAREYNVKGRSFSSADDFDLAPGMSLRTGRDGQLIVSHPAIGETDLRTAIRMGLVEFGPQH
ncbi:MAG: hypothetical protein ACK4MV_09770 [Beijerinckiaceae bacterium]